MSDESNGRTLQDYIDIVQLAHEYGHGDEFIVAVWKDLPVAQRVVQTLRLPKAQPLLPDVSE